MLEKMVSNHDNYVGQHYTITIAVDLYFDVIFAPFLLITYPPKQSAYEPYFFLISKSG